MDTLRSQCRRRATTMHLIRTTMTSIPHSKRLRMPSKVPTALTSPGLTRHTLRMTHTDMHSPITNTRASNSITDHLHLPRARRQTLQRQDKEKRVSLVPWLVVPRVALLATKLTTVSWER